MKKIKILSKYFLLTSLFSTSLFSLAFPFASCNLQQKRQENSDDKEQNDLNFIPYEYFSYEDDFHTITGFAEGITVQQIREEYYTTLQIPPGVEKIAPRAFAFMFDENSTYINKLVLDDDLIEIGDNAFQCCGGFTNDLDFSNTQIKKIGDYAFEDCYGLKSLNFVHPNNEGETLESIGTNAFAFCSALSKINLPYSLETIKSYAFNHCEVLEEIDLSQYKAAPMWAFEKGLVFDFCSTSAKINRHDIKVNTFYTSEDTWSSLLQNQYEEGSNLEIVGTSEMSQDRFSYVEKFLWDLDFDGVYESEIPTYVIGAGDFDWSNIEIIRIPSDFKAVHFFEGLNPPSHPIKLIFDDNSSLRALHMEGQIANHIVCDELTLPSSLEYLDGSWSGCTIEKLVLPNTSKIRFGINLFRETKITEIVFPPKIFSSNVYFAGSWQFGSSRLSHIDFQIPDDVDSIPWKWTEISKTKKKIFSDHARNGIISVRCKDNDSSKTQNRIQNILNNLINDEWCDGSFVIHSKYDQEGCKPYTWFICDYNDNAIPDEWYHINKKGSIDSVSEKFDTDEKFNYSLLQLPENVSKINKDVFKNKFWNDSKKTWLFKPNFGFTTLDDSCFSCEMFDSFYEHGLFFEGHWPASLQKIVRPFGTRGNSTGYNMRGFWDLPRSLNSLIGFDFWMTFIVGVKIHPTLRHFTSPEIGISPFQLSHVEVIDMTSFDSYKQAENLDWDESILGFNEVHTVDNEIKIFVKKTSGSIEDWERALEKYSYLIGEPVKHWRIVYDQE